MQHMLAYILYAVQGCSHSPTLISNTDNKGTAAVTMETTEDAEASEVAVVTLNERIQTQASSHFSGSSLVFFVSQVYLC